MAFNWNMAMKIGKGMHSARKTIQGGMKANDAGGASLQDPNQVALSNMTKRMMRAREVGTSEMAARRGASATARMMHRRSIAAGGRSIAPIMKLIADTEANIAAGNAQERLGILGSLAKQTDDISARSMDLVELANERNKLQGTADKTVGQKNMYAVGEKIQDVIAGNQADKTTSESGGGDKQMQNAAGDFLKKGIKKLFSSFGDNKESGGLGDGEGLGGGEGMDIGGGITE